MIAVRATRRLGCALLVLAGLSAALPADAYEPVLHEFIPPDDGEDLSLAVTTPEGDLPAAIETRSGLVRAPNTERTPGPTDSAYSEPLVPNVSPSYRPDRDTRRPSVVRYEDPFSPSTAPYKRLHAYDMVGAGYTLRVRDTSLSRVPLGGESRLGEEEFYGDLTVDFAEASAVAIPSLGPGTRLLRQHATPDIAVEVWRDGAENWYVKTTAPRPGRVHLVLQLAIARNAFGGDFSMATWSGLPPTAPLPAASLRAFSKVAAAIGLSRSLSPAENVQKLVAYYRAFVPSDEPPRATDDVFLDIALAQRGVCRHRAFAFLVSALGMGIPARMILNEAHAWVEVLGDHWQRIDLGGAAGAIEQGISTDRPSFEPPPDAFAWPSSTETGSGREAARRGQRSSSDPQANEEASSPREPPAAGQASAPVAPPVDRTDARPPSRVSLRNSELVQFRRGAPLAVAGRVDASGAGCGGLRVDVMFRATGQQVPQKVGSLTTDARGVFEGNIFLPFGFPVGDYEMTVETAGDERCGAGASLP